VTILQSLLFSGLFLVIGIVLGFFFSKAARQNRKEIAELKQKLELSEQEHQLYRKEVGEHFTRTSELVNVMTGSYQAVFEHLRKGAAQLCIPGNLIEDASWKVLKNNDDDDPFVEEDLEDLKVHDEEPEEHEEPSFDDHEDTPLPKDYLHAQKYVANKLN
jgi:uncharacterized membrane-anchored protein YhcB (DUF1043 family)